MEKQKSLKILKYLLLILIINIGSLSYATEIKRAASDTAGGDWFGYSVAIAGDYIVTGAVKENDEAGSAYIFYKDSGGVNNWGQQQKISVGSTERFGVSVAIDGNYIVVGSELDSSGSGRAYVYNWSGTSWDIQDTLKADDAAASDYFGISVSISGNYIVVGASGNSDGGDSSGAAYIFERTGVSWNQEAKILASDADTLANEFFGFAVSIDGDYVAVGAPGTSDTGGGAHGAAYIFLRNGDNWNQQARVKPSVAGVAELGRSISLYGSTCAVGAPLNDESFETNVGAVYVFVRSGTSWSEESRIIASDYTSEDRLGSSVAIYDNYIVAGAPNENNYQGSVYSFLRSGTTWNQVDKQEASDGVGGGFDNGNWFGYSVALNSNFAVFGSLLADLNSYTDAGSMYIYETGVDLSLPVELISFEATNLVNYVELTWTTESEIENLGFIILKSKANEENYQEIASYKDDKNLIGQGNSSYKTSYRFIDSEVNEKEVYWYKLQDVSYNGIITEYSAVKIYIGHNPNELFLSRAYPNPFNPSTSFNLRINQDDNTEIKIDIYNSLGQKIYSFHNGRLKEGSYKYTWNGVSNKGIRVSSGIYYLVIRRNNNIIQAQKLNLIK